MWRWWYFVIMRNNNNNERLRAGLGFLTTVTNFLARLKEKLSFNIWNTSHVLNLVCLWIYIRHLRKRAFKRICPSVHIVRREDNLIWAWCVLFLVPFTSHFVQRILPFNDLQMGYRHIALKTDANFPMALPMLFIQIDVKVFINIVFQSFEKRGCEIASTRCTFQTGWVTLWMHFLIPGDQQWEDKW